MFVPRKVARYGQTSLSLRESSESSESSESMELAETKEVSRRSPRELKFVRDTLRLEDLTKSFK